MPLATSLMSAPSASQMLAISLMKEILVAKKALEAYLIISAVRSSVIMMGARSGKCNWATFSAARGSVEPRTVRAGLMKSLMAAPSRKNSGLDTTENGMETFWWDLMISATQSPVPTGTVDLLTI